MEHVENANRPRKQSMDGSILDLALDVFGRVFNILLRKDNGCILKPIRRFESWILFGNTDDRFDGGCDV